MEYWTPCPPPEDREAWRQWNKCQALAAVVVVVLAVVVYLIVRFL